MEPPSSGWCWSNLPDEIKQKFPPPPEAENFDSIEEFEEAKGFWGSRIGRNIAMVMRRYENK